MKREVKMDYELLFLQTLGILAVINGHYNAVETWLNDFFPYYSWHMPFFIFLSGTLFFRSAMKRGSIQYIGHKCQTLLLPGLFVNFCYGVISWVLRHYNFVFFGSDISVRNLLISPFLQNRQFGINIPLWFIFQLFLIELIANFLYRIRIPVKKFYFDILLLVISFAVSYCCVEIRRTSSIRSQEIITLIRTGYLFFFFVSGVFYDQYVKKYFMRMKNPIWGVYAAAALQTVFLLLFNGKKIVIYHLEMNVSIENSLIPYITFATAAVFLLSLARFLSPVLANSRTLRFVGRNLRYVVYHHHFCGLLIGIAALLMYVSGMQDRIPYFNPLSFREKEWYSFALCNNPAGKILYLIIPFFLPLIIGKLINRSSRRSVRVLKWVVLFLAVLAVFIFTGRFFQDGLRNIR